MNENPTGTEFLAAELRDMLTERYPAFPHGGRGRVGLSLHSSDWRIIIDALLRGSEADAPSSQSPTSEAP
jgi:hypothetical protein